jgi:hypothetical protein
MRSEEEVKDLALGLECVYAAYNWKGDNFLFGMYIGKAMALACVLGKNSKEELDTHYDYETWNRVMEERAKARREQRDGDQSPNATEPRSKPPASDE